MKIGYFGDGPWAHAALMELLSDASLKIAFICVRYESPDQTLMHIAVKNNIPFICHKNINSSDFFSSIENYACELFISMSFNQIFKTSLIEYPAHGIINCHAGKLPFYRGRNILNWALINDESEFGITVHYIDDGIDTGDIIVQRSFPISDKDNYGTLLEVAYRECAPLVIEAVRQIQNGNVVCTPQATIHPVGFYCSPRKQGDEILDWNQTSRDVFNFVRAISHPGPQARTFFRGVELMINKVELVSCAPVYKGVPGAVLKKDKNSLLVKTADSFVRVLEWTCDLKIKAGERFK